METTTLSDFGMSICSVIHTIKSLIGFLNIYYLLIFGTDLENLQKQKNRCFIIITQPRLVISAPRNGYTFPSICGDVAVSFVSKPLVPISWLWQHSGNTPATLRLKVVTYWTNDKNIKEKVDHPHTRSFTF